MQKQPIFLLFCLLLIQNLAAQKSLTYVTDRRFKDVSDLLGFNFRPAEKEIKGDGSTPIKPGSVTFGITRDNLFVEGDGIAGVFNINNINPVEYGFKLTLLDARNPAEQGHLKVILNGRKECAAVVFKKGTKSPEIIFHIAELPEELGKKEANFFTDRGELLIENKDSLWGKTIRPFHRLHQNVGIQERLIMADSMSFYFFETTEVIDKNKKAAPKKGDKKLQKVDNQLVVADSIPVGVLDSVVIDPKKIKIIKRHFVRVTGNYKYEDGSQQLKIDNFEIKNIALREDKNAINSDDQFLLEIELEKHSPIQIFLNEKRTVSYLEIDEYNYLMRGF